ncbi:MAG: nicotinate (nicotinamide) nucleotide adenylyltransferase [Alicyclobacillus sp.]|nr:nicotinate (nicotinamide) nucleotide adenylyltransferase [Alicyclobacillus sp.]
MKQVILFGGTFDPPHLGHLLMAQLAYEQTAADEVWWLPAPVPPHKPEDAYVAYADRVAMAELLIADTPYFVVSTIESELETPSYTVDTVRACKARYPDCSFQFLLGSDSLAQLPDWHEAEALTREITFVVASRAGYPFSETLCEVQRCLPDLRAVELVMPLLDVSSTWLRQRLGEGRPVCGLTTPAVLERFQACIARQRQQANGTAPCGT